MATKKEAREVQPAPKPRAKPAHPKALDETTSALVLAEYLAVGN